MVSSPNNLGIQYTVGDLYGRIAPRREFAILDPRFPRTYLGSIVFYPAYDTTGLYVEIPPLEVTFRNDAVSNPDDVIGVLEDPGRTERFLRHIFPIMQETLYRGIVTFPYGL